MLTVQSLLDELDLELVAGADAASAPVRWVHISELQDPTPWLNGGELMLTTGIPLDTAAKQRAFVRILADRNLAGRIALHAERLRREGRPARGRPAPCLPPEPRDR